MYSNCSIVDSALESAFQAMIDGMEVKQQSEAFERNRVELLKSMHAHIRENIKYETPLMGIGNVHVGSVTINVLAITSLLLNELAKSCTDTDLHILLIAAVFICSLINAFEIDEPVKLNQDAAIVYCTLIQLADNKEAEVIMVSKGKLIERLGKECLGIDIDGTLQLLRNKRIIVFKGNHILVTKVRNIAVG